MARLTDSRWGQRTRPNSVTFMPASVRSCARSPSIQWLTRGLSGRPAARAGGLGFGAEQFSSSAERWWLWTVRRGRPPACRRAVAAWAVRRATTARDAWRWRGLLLRGSARIGRRGLSWRRRWPATTAPAVARRDQPRLRARRQADPAQGVRPDQGHRVRPADPAAPPT